VDCSEAQPSPTIGSSRTDHGPSPEKFSRLNGILVWSVLATASKMQLFHRIIWRSRKDSGLTADQPSRWCPPSLPPSDVDLTNARRTNMIERFGCLGIILIVLALVFAVAKFFPPSPQAPPPPATWAEYRA
jgi:hypothetical protein